MLRKNFFSAEELTAIVEDFTQSGLSDEEVAIMSFAQKVVGSAHSIAGKDIDRLRAYGLEEQEILDVILAAAARCFFGHSLDAAGIEPDQAYLKDLDGDLYKVLAVGRPWNPERDEPE